MQYIFSNHITTGIVMGCIVAVAITAIICRAITKMNRDDNQLKQSMIDRGMSAEEIEKVMNAD